MLATDISCKLLRLKDLGPRSAFWTAVWDSPNGCVCFMKTVGGHNYPCPRIKYQSHLAGR